MNGKDLLAIAVAVALATAMAAAGAVAQQPATDPAAVRAAVGRCEAAARAKDEEGADSIADGAERALAAWMRAQPAAAEPRIQMARLKTGCRIPFASFMTQGMLIGQSNELLQEALRLEPANWGAHFRLAMNHYHTPAFLGRSDDAIRSFEAALRLQGDRTDVGAYATTYAFLGDLYTRAGRDADARAMWERGARLFPDDPGLKQRHGGTAGGGAAVAAPSAHPAAAPAAPPLATDARPAGATPAATATAPATERAAIASPAHTRTAETAGADAARTGAAPASTAPAPAAGDTARRPRTVTLEGLVASAGGSRMDDTRSGTALRRVDVLTTPGGAADVMQAFQTVPGSTRVGDGADLYVRGGDPAESPVFVNGARLIYPGRYESLNGGVFGILDSNVISTAFFASGGFSARYGDALSGVLDIETRGRPEMRMARVNASTVQAAATADLPLGDRAGAWGSLRATDTRVMLRMHGRGDEFATSPRALEGMAGVVWEPRRGTTLQAVGLLDDDESAREVEAYDHRGAFRTGSGNRLAALSFRTVSRDGGRGLRASLSAARRTSGFEFGVLDRRRADGSLHLRVEGDARVGGTRLRAGAEAQRLTARHTGVLPTTDRLDPGAPSEAVDEREDTRHLGGFAEAEAGIGDRVAVVAGLRADRLPGEDAWTVDPRAAVAVHAGAWTMRLGGGVFHQGRWRTRYSVPDEGTPSGTPTRARHLVAGAERNGYPSLRVEAFVKRYDAYAPRGEGPRVVAGRAAGMDAIVRWETRTDRRVSGWVTYSYLDGTVALEGGGTVRSAVDVTHSLTAVGRVRVSGPWELGLTARYGTGRPYTPVLGPADDGGPAYGAIHGARMPDHRRLDARVTRYLSTKAGVGVLYAEMLNLLDIGNVAAYSYGAGYRERTAVPSFFAQRTVVVGAGIPF